MGGALLVGLINAGVVVVMSVDSFIATLATGSLIHAFITLMTQLPGAGPVLQGGVSPEVAVSPACHPRSAARSWDNGIASGDNQPAGSARDLLVLRVPQGMGHGAIAGAARVSPP